MEDLEERLERWRRAGLITGSQAESIRSYEQARPRSRAGPPARYAAPPPLPRPRPQVPPPPPGTGPRPPERGSLGSGALRPPGLLADDGPLIELPIGAPDGRLVGLAMALLALVGVVVGIFSVTVDLLIAPTHNAGGDLEDALHLVASVLGATGGVRMARGAAGGRRLVLASLGINLAATAVLSFRKLGEGGTLVEMLLWIGLGVVVAAARFHHSARGLQG